MNDQTNLTRRALLSHSASGLGSAALLSLLRRSGTAEEPELHLPAKAKRVIYLFQSGGPPQMDLF